MKQLTPLYSNVPDLILITSKKLCKIVIPIYLLSFNKFARNNKSIFRNQANTRWLQMRFGLVEQTKMESILLFQELGDKIGWFYSRSQETGQVSYIQGARRQDRLVLFQELGERIGQFYSRSQKTEQVSYIQGARRQDSLVIFKEVGDRIGYFYSRSQETRQVSFIPGARRQDRLVIFKELEDRIVQLY